MAGSSGLPLIGAEAVVLGIAAFNANIQQVVQRIKSVETATGQLVTAQARLDDIAVRGTAAVTNLSKAISGIPVMGYVKDAMAAADASERVAKGMGQAAIAAVATAQGYEAAATAARANATAAATLLARGGAASGMTPASVKAAEDAAKSAEQAYAKAAKAAEREISDAVRAADMAAAKSIARDVAVARQEEELSKEIHDVNTAFLEATAAEEEATAARIAAVRTAAFIGVAAAAAVAVAAMAAAEAAAAKYNDQMNSVQVVSKATAGQMKALDDAQMSLGRTTTISAQALADFSNQAVRDGLSVAQLNAGVLKAADSMLVVARGELSASEAAKIQTQSINTFGATAEQAANAATAAVNNSLIGWNGYAAAISNVGAIAAKNGVNINEFSALVATAGKTMQDGSAIGAGLRQMFERLEKPSDDARAEMIRWSVSLYDAQGHLVPTVELVRRLTDAFGPAAIASGKLSEAERDRALDTIMGSRSAEVMVSIMNQGTKAYEDNLRAAINLSTADLAGQVMKPSAEQAKILKGNIDALTLSFGKGLDPAITHLLTITNSWLEALDDSKVQQFAAALVWLDGKAVSATLKMLQLMQVFSVLSSSRDVIEWVGRGFQPETRSFPRSTAPVPPGGYLEGAAMTGSAGGIGFPESQKSLKEIQDAMKNADKIAEEFNRAVEKDTNAATRQMSTMYVDAYDRIGKATQQNAENIRKARDAAAQQISDTQTANLVREDQERRRRALDDRLKGEETARRIRLEGEADANKRENEDKERALKEQGETRDREFKQEQQDEETLRKDTIAFTEQAYKNAQRQREQDLKDWQTIQERVLADGQKQLELNLKQEQQARELSLKQNQQAREEALKDQLAAEERTAKDSQRIEQERLQATLDEEKKRLSLGNDLQEVLNTDKRERDKAQSEYAQDIAKGVRQDIAQRRLNKKLTEISGQTAEGRTRVADRSKEVQAEIDLDTDQQKRTDALKAKFEQQDVNRQADAEKRRRDLAADTERETLKLRTDTENETFKLQQDTEGKVAAMREQHERDRVALANTIADEELTHAQGNAQAETEFKRRQEQEYIAQKQIIDAQERTGRQQLEDADRDRRHGLELDEAKFQAEQAQARLDLQQQFEEEELRRRIAAIEHERDVRIAEIQKAFDADIANQKEALARQLADFRESLDDRLKALQTEYLDKLSPLLELGDAKVTDRVNGIIDGINKGIAGVKQTVQETTDAIANAFDAEKLLADAEERRRRNPLPPPFQPVVTGPGVGDTADRQYGGTVPGRYGAARWIIAHGGERFEGLGAYNTTLASVRAAEAMWQRGIGGSHYVTNQYSYNVDAHYGRTQDEGSIARDLSALVMLTRN